MTDAYRTAVNPYTAKAAEARAKLERQRAEAAEVERQRAEMLREINEAIAPLRVARNYNHYGNTVEISHENDRSTAILLCSEADMLENLPRIIGSTYFAEAAEKLEQSVTTVARRESLGLAAIERPSLPRRLVSPVLATAGATVTSCWLAGDFTPIRVAFVALCLLAFNLWWLDTFKRSPP